MFHNFPVLLSNTIFETWSLILSSLLASLHPIWLLFLLNFCPQVSESQFLSKSTAINQAGPICGSPHALLSYTQLLKQSSSCSPQNDWQVSFMAKPQCPVGSSSSRHHINCSGCSIASILTDSQSGFLPQGNALGQTQQTWMWILVLPLTICESSKPPSTHLKNR